MKEIKIKFQHQKLIFEIDGESYFLLSSEFLELLSAEKMRDVFHNLDPHVKFADLNRFGTAVLYSNLKDRDASSKEIATALNISELILNEWLETIGKNFIEQVKKQRKGDFNAQYQKLNDFSVSTLIKMYKRI